MARNDNEETRQWRREQRGTRLMLGWAAGAGLIAAVAFVVLAVIWPMFPGSPDSSQPDTVNGVMANQSQGVSTAGKRTPVPPAVEPDTMNTARVTRAEKILSSEQPDLKMSAAQVNAIQSYVQKNPGQRLHEVKASISVGAAVPRQVPLRNVPPQLAQHIPLYGNDKYFVAGRSFVLVEGETRRIIAIVPVAS